MKSTEMLNQIKTLLNIEVKLEEQKLENGTRVEAESFEKGKEIDLKIACVNEIEQPCNATIHCNLTILYPNSTALVDNQIMDYGASYYNYTINPNDTSVLGEYSANIFCLGTGNGYSTFKFMINPT